MVTNCKGRLGSIATEAPINRILIILYISKNFVYADSGFIKFIKFKNTHQKLKNCENLPDFRKRGKQSHNAIGKNVIEKYAKTFSGYFPQGRVSMWKKFSRVTFTRRGGKGISGHGLKNCHKLKNFLKTESKEQH